MRYATEKKIDLRGRYLQGPESMLGSATSATEYTPGITNPLTDLQKELKQLYPKMTQGTTTAIDVAFSEHFQEMLAGRGAVTRQFFSAFKQWVKPLMHAYHAGGDSAVETLAVKLFTENAPLFDNVLTNAIKRAAIDAKWNRTIAKIVSAIGKAAKSQPPEVRNGLSSLADRLKRTSEDLLTRYKYFYYSTPAMRETLSPDAGFRAKVLLETVGAFKSK